MTRQTPFLFRLILCCALLGILFFRGLPSLQGPRALALELDPNDPASLSECVTQWFQQRQEFLPRLGCDPAGCVLEIKAVAQADPYCALWVAISDPAFPSSAPPRTLVLLLERDPADSSYAYLGAGGVAEPFGICCLRRDDVLLTAFAGEEGALPEAASYRFTLSGQTYTFPLPSQGPALSLQAVPFSGSMALGNREILDREGHVLQSYQ